MSGDVGVGVGGGIGISDGTGSDDSIHLGRCGNTPLTNVIAFFVFSLIIGWLAMTAISKVWYV